MVTLVSRFSTQFHRDLASPEWLLELATHIENAISTQRGYQTSDAEGVVFSQYNEERYMGPLSVCKFYFNVTVQVRRSNVSRNQDRYEACVQYCADTDTFKTLHETLDTNETRNRKREELDRRKATMQSTDCRLRENFENREAIYIEKGALRVRVFHIHANVDEQMIAADVEEIPTVGLGVGMHPTWDSQERRTAILSWDIGAGNLSTFSDNSWSMGYGGWTLFFDQKVVEGVVSLAADWPNELSDYVSRYNEILKYLGDNGAYEGEEERVFPDE